MICKTIFLCIFALTSVIIRSEGASLFNNGVKVTNEPIDSQGKYLLSWEVDLASGSITFDIEAETTGYVGLGISPVGNMAGADIFIGGVSANGNTYAHDMHGLRNGPPVQDNHTDWTLLAAREDANKTFLKVSRLLNTCDDEDYPISNDTIRLIWAMGADDNIAYHNTTRGSKSLNLVLPDEPDFNPDDYTPWDIDMTIEMPAEDTTYWCNIRKAPNLTQKHHIVSFQPHFTNDLALAHTHHFTIYRCEAPPGEDAEELFEPWVNHAGEPCYLEAPEMPTMHCMGKYVYVWSIGGKGMVLPEDLGHPFPHEPGKSNYYMMEVHYDNPQKLQNLTFTTGAQVLYTDELRPTDAGLLTLAYDVGILLTIPPDQTDFVVAGHCGAGCTEDALPEDGIKIFNSLLHAHLAGKKMKVRHIRGDKELPWLDFDNHYDFNYQSNKPLMEHVQVRRGDHLTVECQYETKNRTVIGGLSTREEMCMAFLWYYPMQPNFDYCGSIYEPDHHWADLGITNYTFTMPPGGGLTRWTIIEPTELAGDYEEVLSTKFPWNATYVKTFERNRRYERHEGTCGGQTAAWGFYQFPDDFEKYVPEDVCATRGEEGDGGDKGTTTEKGGSSTVGSSTQFVTISAVIAAILKYNL